MARRLFHRSSPRLRIGGKNSWLNLSRKGVSASVKTPLGTYNTRRGFTARRPWWSRTKGGCCGLMLPAMVLVAGVALMGLIVWIR